MSEALYTAIVSADWSAVAKILQEGVDPNTNTGGGYALYVASTLGNTLIVKQLLAAGADVNRRDPYVSPPLHSAVTHNHLGVVMALCDHNASANARTTFGDTPLHCACQEEETATHGINICMNIAIIGELIDRGATIDAVNHEGDTPLHCAVGANCYNITKYLLFRGADPTIKNKLGETMIDIIVHYGGSLEMRSLFNIQ